MPDSLKPAPQAPAAPTPAKIHELWAAREDLLPADFHPPADDAPLGDWLAWTARAALALESSLAGFHRHDASHREGRRLAAAVACRELPDSRAMPAMTEADALDHSTAASYAWSCERLIPWLSAALAKALPDFKPVALRVSNHRHPDALPDLLADCANIRRAAADRAALLAVEGPPAATPEPAAPPAASSESAPAPDIDARAFVPASALVGEHARTLKILRGILRNHPEIRTHKPSPQRLLVHAGDWHKHYLARRHAAAFEALDADPKEVGALVTAALGDADREQDTIKRGKMASAVPTSRPTSLPTALRKLCNAVKHGKSE